MYDEYADRGESENRNKELKCEFQCDRLSDHRYMANLFRVMMHCVAANLLVVLRGVAELEPLIEACSDPLPLEARSERQKRRHHNRRRQRDPLGEGHASTWRTHVIKVASRIVVTTRRVRILIPASWPWSDYLKRLSEALADYCPPQPSD